MRILFDGWPLIYDPASPSALHLATLLRTKPADVHAVLALPGQADHLNWLPSEITCTVQATGNSQGEHLTWEQKSLPKIASQQKVDHLHTCGTSLAFFSPVPTSISPSGWHTANRSQDRLMNPGGGFTQRIRLAVGQGGISRAAAVFCPDDLSLDLKHGYKPIPPVIHPHFLSGHSQPISTAWAGQELPETFILYHGPLRRRDLERLMAVWRWAAEAISSYSPLILYGIMPHQKAQVEAFVQHSGLEDSIRLLLSGSPTQLSALYHGCAFLLQTAGVSLWGDPIRHSLACGKPVIAEATPLTDALVGEAGYLVPKDDLRAMGAAVITLVIEEELTQQMSERAQKFPTGSAAAYWQTFLARIRNNS